MHCFFPQQDRACHIDRVKIDYFVQLLRDRALNWAQAVLKTNLNISYDEFVSQFKGVFSKDTCLAAAAHHLLNLKRSMADYSIDFHILAVETGWTKERDSPK